MKRGTFIVFEGLDGSGKTTQCRLLSSCLSGKNIPHIFTRQPSDGRVGRLVREASDGLLRLESETIALLFAADRYQHAFTEILPALESGVHVLCDRYYYSSLAYQKDEAYEYNKKVISGLKPDITFFIDVPPEECLGRIKDRGGQGLYENAEALTRARVSYLSTFETLNEGGRIIIIDAAGLSAGEVFERVWEHIRFTPPQT